MTSHQFLVTAHTDMVPGDCHTPESLLQGIERTLKGNMPYVDNVQLVSEDLASDILHTDAIPLAEFEYLKEHSPIELLTKLRDAQDRSKRRVILIDDLLHEAILMISALNAVKVMDPVKQEKIASANRLFTELLDDTQLFEDMCHLEPELMGRLRKAILEA